MKYRKVAALALSLVMAFSVAACGGGGEEQKDADASVDAPSTESSQDDNAEAPADDSAQASDITLWTYPIGSWGDSAVVDGLIASFNEVHPEINVTVEYLDYTNGDDQINTAIEGGQAPDIVLEGPERLVANWEQKD